MIPAWTPMLMALGGACLFQFVLWLVMLRQRNAGIVDAGWATSLGLMGVLYAFAYDGDPARRILIATLSGLWGLRLGFYLWTDRVMGRSEEGRYVRLREIWGSRANAHFLWFFQAQAVLAVFLALPFAYAANATNLFPGIWDYIGAALFITGWIGESISDRQLTAFKRDPNSQGKTCRRGLWKYSRHPNYFFEWILWCGFGSLALMSQGGWIGWVSPITLLVLILKVTGIPPTEAQALRSRGEDYRAYQRTTSSFVPWPPKKDVP